MSSSSKQRQLKSILKPSKSTSPSSSTPNPKAEAERIALSHARIIQSQKDLQHQIFENINLLSTLPLVRSPSYTSSRPSPSDTASFKDLIRPLQPSDYDDLIEERNILGSCGYALCPLPRRTLGTAKFSLVNKSRPDFGVVETRELERWCSDQCARRALYVKVQLNETAAWERIGMPALKIDLYEEEEEEQSGRDADLARDIAKLKLDEEKRASAALAAERVGAGPKIELTIREKKITSVAIPPSQEVGGRDDDGHLLLEGHRTRFGAEPEESDADEGMED